MKKIMSAMPFALSKSIQIQSSRNQESSSHCIACSLALAHEVFTSSSFFSSRFPIDRICFAFTYLVDVDGGLPELLLGLVEVAHTDLTKVTGMVLVKVGTVVVLTTGHTTTTGGLAVLADTTVTGGHMTAAKKK